TAPAAVGANRTVRVPLAPAASGNGLAATVKTELGIFTDAVRTAFPVLATPILRVADWPTVTFPKSTGVVEIESVGADDAAVPLPDIVNGGIAPDGLVIIVQVSLCAPALVGVNRNANGTDAPGLSVIGNWVTGLKVVCSLPTERIVTGAPPELLSVVVMVADEFTLTLPKLNG